MAGTYNNINQGVSGWAMGRHFLTDVVSFPFKYTLSNIIRPALGAKKNGVTDDKTNQQLALF